MGLFSGLKKVAKKVFKGVKKVFKKVGSFVDKVLDSKWGKALLVAAAVFTGGMALAAGIGAFTGQAASATFLSKFVAGAKGFMSALVNPAGAAKGFFGAQGQGLGAMAQGAAQGVGALPATTQGAQALAGTPVTDPAAVLAEGAAAPAGGGAATAGLSAPVGVVPPPATGVPAVAGTAPAAAGAAPAAPGGFLSRAGQAVGEFLKSPGGGTLAAGALRGYAQGAMTEEMLKEQERIRRYYDEAWRDPRQVELLQAASGRGISTPQGFLERARRFSRETDRPSYVPRVTMGAARGGG